MNTTQLTQLRLRPNTAQSHATLALAPLSDTGVAVPVGITVRAPLGLSIQSVELFAPDNPEPSLFKISFDMPFNQWQFDTRIRLGASQEVWLVVTLSDGSLMGSHLPTVLTSSACFDAS